MVKKINFLISLFLLLIGIFGIFLFLKTLSFKERNELLSSFFKKEILLALIFTFLANLFGSIKWQKILKKLGCKISFWRNFSLYQGVLGIMFFVPLLSLPSQFFKAFILEKKFFISLSKSSASIFLDVVSEWTIFLFLIFFSLFALFSFLFRIKPGLSLFLIFSLLILSFGIFIFYFSIFKKRSLVRFFFREISDKNLLWQTEREIFSYLQEKSNFFEIFFFSILKTFFLYLRTLFLVKIFTRNFQFLFSFSALGLSFLTALIPIPAGLATQEAIQNLLFLTKNFSRVSLLTFTFGNRFVDFVFSIFGILLMFFSLTL